MLKLYRFTCLCLISLTAQSQITSTAAIVPVTPNLCTDKPLTFSVSTNATVNSYLWSVYSTSGATFLSDAGSSSISLSFSKDLTYTLTLTMETTEGTIVTKKAVRIARTAKASFNADLSGQGHPSELVLTNYSSFSIKNYWIFDPEQLIDSSYNFTKYYTSSGNFKVSLLAFGSKGCNDTVSYAFRISDSSSVSLPNVFSPNGDGINDEFRPLTTGLTALNCWIYDRQGYLMEKWYALDGTWDGRTNAGEPCSAGVYFVVVEAWGFDGKIYKLSGTLTLVR